ncbi:23920_t:CDS:2, partial [Gigaspora rosea]
KAKQRDSWPTKMVVRKTFTYHIRYESPQTSCPEITYMQWDYFGIQEFYQKMTRIEQLSHPENLPYGLEYH